jgi:hypothetical protein
MLTAALVALLLALAGPALAQRQVEFVAVGVRYQLDPDPARRRRDLEEIRRLRFNVVAPPQESAAAEMELTLVDRVLAGAADAQVRMSGVATVSGKDAVSASHVTHAAWYYLGMGARGIIFGDWAALQRNTEALTAATAFADEIARNAALYAPLRPRVPGADIPDVTVEGNDPRITARVLESAEALLLVVTNHDGSEAREVTLHFSPDLPEAIWQNMLTGAAVNFVAGPKGPIYSRTFPPKDVLVLMIRKRWK